MNKKGDETSPQGIPVLMAIIVIILVALCVIIVFLVKTGAVTKIIELINPGYNRPNTGISEMPEAMATAISALHQHFLDALLSKEERCFVEYPETPDLLGDKIRLQSVGGALHFIYKGQQGQIIDYGRTIPGAEPCIVAGTEKGVIVAKNFADNWKFLTEEWDKAGPECTGECKAPEYIAGDSDVLGYISSGVRMYREIVTVQPQQYTIKYDYLYKPDATHVCFIGFYTNGFPGCEVSAQGVADDCFGNPNKLMSSFGGLNSIIGSNMCPKPSVGTDKVVLEDWVNTMQDCTKESKATCSCSVLPLAGLADVNRIKLIRSNIQTGATLYYLKTIKEKEEAYQVSNTYYMDIPLCTYDFATGSINEDVPSISIDGTIDNSRVFSRGSDSFIVLVRKDGHTCIGEHSAGEAGAWTISAADSTVLHTGSTAMEACTPGEGSGITLPEAPIVYEPIDDRDAAVARRLIYDQLKQKIEACKGLTSDNCNCGLFLTLDLAVDYEVWLTGLPDQTTVGNLYRAEEAVGGPSNVILNELCSDDLSMGSNGMRDELEITLKSAALPEYSFSHAGGIAYAIVKKAGKVCFARHPATETQWAVTADTFAITNGGAEVMKLCT